MRMRIHFLLKLAPITIFFFFNATNLYADQALSPVHETTAAITKIFTIDGFDSNDVTEVGVYGYLTSSCYQVGGVKASVDPSSKSVDVIAKAYRYNDGTCLEMLIPFFEVVKLGVLQDGEYQVRSAENPESNTKMLIKKASRDQIDDYLYAPVRHVDMHNTAQGVYLTLQGRFPLLKTGCMVLKEVRHYTTANDVLVVQPIAKVAEGSECAPEKTPTAFSTSIKIDNFKGERLLHVRALGGSSVTRLVETLQ